MSANTANTSHKSHAIKDVTAASKQKEKDEKLKPTKEEREHKNPNDAKIEHQKKQVHEGPNAEQYVVNAANTTSDVPGLNPGTGPVMRSEYANTETGAVNISAENNPAVYVTPETADIGVAQAEAANKARINKQVEDDMQAARQKELDKANGKPTEDAKLGAAKNTVE